MGRGRDLLAIDQEARSPIAHKIRRDFAVALLKFIIICAILNWHVLDVAAQPC